MKIVLFEIEDARGRFITSFNSAKAVEDFFLFLPSNKNADDFTVLGFDESNYLIQTWYAQEIEVGSFIRDVENYEKRNNQKIVQEKDQRHKGRTPRKN